MNEDCLKESWKSPIVLTKMEKKYGFQKGNQIVHWSERTMYINTDRRIEASQKGKCIENIRKETISKG